jgi:hypothetical protein
MPLLNLKVFCRCPECYREGGAVPSARWLIPYMPCGHFLWIFWESRGKSRAHRLRAAERNTAWACGRCMGLRFRGGSRLGARMREACAKRARNPLRGAASHGLGVCPRRSPSGLRGRPSASSQAEDPISRYDRRRTLRVSRPERRPFCAGGPLRAGRRGIFRRSLAHSFCATVVQGGHQTARIYIVSSDTRDPRRVDDS